MSWPAGLFTEPVTILSAARGDDDYGPGAADWDNPSSYDTTARLQPAGGNESLINTDVQQGDLLCYLPPGTPVTGRDRMVYDEDTYEVIGPAQRWRAPWSGSEHHVRVLLRLVQRVSVATSGERDAEVSP
jgi:hypothetical protein